MKPFRIAESWRSQLPEHAAYVLELYVNHGPAVLSDFYYSLMSGDAFGAALLADAENRAAMGTILATVAATFPGDCYGSREAVEGWQGRLYGQPFSVPESWTLAVEELRHDGPKTNAEWEADQQPSVKRALN